MKKVFILLWIAIIISLSSGFLFSSTWTRRGLLQIPHEEAFNTNQPFQLSAKKAKQLFSEDFLAALNDENDDKDEDLSKTAKSKKKLPASSPISEDKELEDLQGKVSKKAKKQQAKKAVEDVPLDLSGDSDAVEGTEKLITQPKANKKDKSNHNRLSSKIRLTDRSQPPFVMMGLQNVELMFGDDAVVRNASFSVATGERVGLVGPNGGGKVC